MFSLERLKNVLKVVSVAQVKLASKDWLFLDPPRKNNSRGITLRIGLLWRINSLTLHALTGTNCSLKYKNLVKSCCPFRIIRVERLYLFNYVDFDTIFAISFRICVLLGTKIFNHSILLTGFSSGLALYFYMCSSE